MSKVQDRPISIHPLQWGGKSVSFVLEQASVILNRLSRLPDQV